MVEIHTHLHETTRTGILSLPFEILGVVCGHCTSYNADAPLILSLVNRTFHAVVHGTPRAWSKLKLSQSQGSERSLVRKAGLWFARACECGLDLFVDITGDQTLPFLIAFLSHHRENILTLNVQSTTELKAYDFLDAIFPSKPTSCPTHPAHLRNLRLRITSDITQAAPSSWSPVWNSFDRFPGLRSLKLTNHILPALPTPNLSSLHTLCILRPLRAPPLATHKIARLIRSAPMLEVLEVDTRISVTPGVEGGIETNRLQKLSLRTNNLPSVLSLVAPATLEELRLIDLDGRRVGAAFQLGAAVKRISLGRLRSLEVSGVSFTSNGAENWQWCINHMGKLESMSISDFHGDSSNLVSLLTAGACSDLRYVCLSGLKALSPLQKLKMARPDVTVEWETVASRTRVFEIGVGSPSSMFEIQREAEQEGQVKNVIGHCSGEIRMNDIDEFW
uniref:F-box domain-containing protein n=1 Tax=Moniliophthora roreri TaxID=221103 RepID=A0A0W0FMB5_MONRR